MGRAGAGYPRIFVGDLQQQNYDNPLFNMGKVSADKHAQKKKKEKKSKSRTSFVISSMHVVAYET